MNKYLRAAICVSVTGMKFLWLKIKKRSHFNCSIINLCSPMSEVEISGKGRLTIGTGFKMRSNSHVRVRNNAEMKIGNDVSLQYGDMIVCHEKITIGNNVQLSPNVLIYDHDHDFRAKDGLKKLLYKTSPVTIGDNVWIGANTVILRGTTIGDNCVIGAGCVLKGNYPDDSIIVQKRENKINLLRG